MLLDGPPSWRQWGRPEAIDLPQDFGEQCFGDGDFRHLKRDIATMAGNLGNILDQLLP